MSVRVRTLAALVLAAALSACNPNGPGPLEGTWRATGLVPITVTFRAGEADMLGITEKVSYSRKGQDVTVMYESGPLKGTGVRYTITGPDTITSPVGTLQRVRPGER
jgi:hypothetical protein